MKTLTQPEKCRLVEHEEIIGRNLKAFYETGTSLLAIRDGRLYRETHGTFEEYLQDRWDIGRAHAYRLISATQTVENLSPIGDIPATESQVRELSGLNPEAQREAWRKALETAPDRKPTATHIRQAAGEFRGKRKYGPDYLEIREEIDRLRREADKLLSVKTKTSSRRTQRLLKEAQEREFRLWFLIIIEATAAALICGMGFICKADELGLSLEDAKITLKEGLPKEESTAIIKSIRIAEKVLIWEQTLIEEKASTKRMLSICEAFPDFIELSKLLSGCKFNPDLFDQSAFELM